MWFHVLLTIYSHNYAFIHVHLTISVLTECYYGFRMPGGNWRKYEKRNTRIGRARRAKIRLRSTTLSLSLLFSLFFLYPLSLSLPSPPLFSSVPLPSLSFPFFPLPYPSLHLFLLIYVHPSSHLSCLSDPSPLSLPNSVCNPTSLSSFQ